MKKKVKVLCAVLCAAAAAVSFAYAAAAGTASDPLVTLSYLTQRFTPQMKTAMEELAAQKAEELTKQFEAEIAKVSAGAGTEAGASVFSVVTLSEDQVLTGDVGCEVMLRVGTAACVSDGSTGLIDVTDGSNLKGGKSLTKNHLYMVTISTRGVKATAGTVKLLVRGPYTVA